MAKELTNGEYAEEQWHKLQLIYENVKEKIIKEIEQNGEGGWGAGKKIILTISTGKTTASCMGLNHILITLMSDTKRVKSGQRQRISI